MCGYVGFTNHIDNSNQVLQSMMDKIRHRGPDAEGAYIDEDIALGHRRLSIIDVTESGNQPLYSQDGNLILVYNGEIYNYREIRSRLQEAGYHFATQTDSEVLIYGYQEYGADLLMQLRGMFSFVIWDKRKKNFSVHGISLALSRCTMRKWTVHCYSVRKSKASCVIPNSKRH